MQERQRGLCRLQRLGGFAAAELVRFGEQHEHRLIGRRVPRPGVLLKKARRVLCVIALIALDLPAFERPAKATSAPVSGGSSAGVYADAMKRASRNIDIGRCYGV